MPDYGYFPNGISFRPDDPDQFRKGSRDPGNPTTPLFRTSRTYQEPAPSSKWEYPVLKFELIDKLFWMISIVRRKD